MHRQCLETPHHVSPDRGRFQNWPDPSSCRRIATLGQPAERNRQSPEEAPSHLLHECPEQRLRKLARQEQRFPVKPGGKFSKASHETRITRPTRRTVRHDQLSDGAARVISNQHDVVQLEPLEKLAD
jgi:hypothetical protein